MSNHRPPQKFIQGALVVMALTAAAWCVGFALLGGIPQ